MYYVYILKEKGQKHFYVGSTNNLKRRLKEHFKDKSSYFLYSYFALPFPELARNFEKYLKTGSGRAFIKKHFSIKSFKATKF